jgi:transposase InsO family protein
MVAWDAGGGLAGLTHHSDHGSNYMAMVYTDRIIELGAVPSTGTVGDSFDNALAEAINNLYKTELIRQQGPWRTVEQVELATLEWVWGTAEGFGYSLTCPGFGYLSGFGVLGGDCLVLVG